MPDIVLSTLNARYAHSAFGLRYLLANLGALREHAVLLEFDLSHRPVDVAESLLAQRPRLLGLGVYVWNAQPMLELVGLLKRIRPDLLIVLGGPEVSHETDQQEICRLADYVIQGEADLEFAGLCRQVLDGMRPGRKVIQAAPPDLARVALPYALYDDHDLRTGRVVYVEASRGCPFECEFCLSALDQGVRSVPLAPFLAAMGGLWDRGLRHFKFVDRTFNLNVHTSRAILEFFLARLEAGPASPPGGDVGRSPAEAGAAAEEAAGARPVVLHFEMIPDRFPPALRELVARFPPGVLQFEVGIQSFDEAVCARISRRQNRAAAEDNLRWLRTETGVHVHADLIVGLPGEDLEGFAAGFDRLLALGPQEIQVGLLKRLRGAPIARHDQEWGMVYSPHPPYEILHNRLIGFADMQRLRRFARYWDLLANSGNFVDSPRMLWDGGPAPARTQASGNQGRGAGPFAAFLAFSDWLHAQVGRAHGIALPRLARLLFDYLTEVRGRPAEAVGVAMAGDFARAGRDRRDLPQFLRRWAPDELPPGEGGPSARPLLPRQRRHAGHRSTRPQRH